MDLTQPYDVILHRIVNIIRDYGWFPLDSYVKRDKKKKIDKLIYPDHINDEMDNAISFHKHKLNLLFKEFQTFHKHIILNGMSASEAYITTYYPLLESKFKFKFETKDIYTSINITSNNNDIVYARGYFSKDPKNEKIKKIIEKLERSRSSKKKIINAINVISKFEI